MIMLVVVSTVLVEEQEEEPHAASTRYHCGSFSRTVHQVASLRVRIPGKHTCDQLYWLENEHLELLRPERRDRVLVVEQTFFLSANTSCCCEAVSSVRFPIS